MDCAASFPGLRELVVHDVDPVAFCEQLRLRFARGDSAVSGVSTWNRPRPLAYEHAYFKRKTRSAIQDTLHKIPVDLAMELLLKGFYPRMQAPHEGNYNEWTRAFFDVLSRGARHSIMANTLRDEHGHRGLNAVQVFRAPGPQATRAVFARLYDTLEALIARGADPNVCVAAREYDWRRGTVLWHILDMLFEKWSYHRPVLTTLIASCCLGSTHDRSARPARREFVLR